MSKTSKAQAQAAQHCLSTDIVRTTEGNGLTKDKDGNWVVVLYLAKEMPAGAFPAEIDGVKITTKVIGEVEAHAK